MVIDTDADTVRGRGRVQDCVWDLSMFVAVSEVERVGELMVEPISRIHSEQILDCVLKLCLC